MRLYIAEKPSVAKAIASHLPGPHQKVGGTHIVCGNGIIVTWCFGHMLEDWQPADYNPEWKNWKRTHLPMVPETFRLRVSADKKTQFAAIKQLVKEATEIVHAGDIAREGQLIVDEVLDYIGNKKPVRRVLIDSIDDETVRRALRADEEVDNAPRRTITSAGYARRIADWLYGMNLTEAYTLAARASGYPGGVLKVGRVKTPTMRLVVERDAAIESFVSAPYYGVIGTNAAADTEFTARWQPDPERVILDPEKRLLDKRVADACAQRVSGVEGLVIGYTDKEKDQAPPPLYSLSALQIDASKRYGLPVKKTLDIAQKLYEEKIITYPRTDSRYAKVSQFAEAGKVLANVAAIYAPLAGFIVQADLSYKTSVWNDAKTGEHHAIIPTLQNVDLSGLNEAERNVYDLIARSYVAQFLGPYHYRRVTIELAYVGETFTTSGNTPLVLGWKALYATPGKQARADDDDISSLPQLTIGQSITCSSAVATESFTEPPERFTEGALVHAMTNIHEYVTDPKLRKKLREVKGIGTEATRGGIIDALKRDEFLIETTEKGKKRKVLVSSPKARGLIGALDPQITDYGLTALFEQELAAIAEGAAQPADFVAEMVAFVDAGVKAAFAAPVLGSKDPGAHDAVGMDGGGARPPAETVGPCPRCRDGVVGKRQRRDGSGFFWACTAYPVCTAAWDDLDGQPDYRPRPEREPSTDGPDCPTCKRAKLRTRTRKDKSGVFWACSSYPKCDAAFNDRDGQPDFTPRKARGEKTTSRR